MLTAREYGAASNQTLLIDGRLILVAPALCLHSRSREGSTHRLVAEARRLNGCKLHLVRVKKIGETNIGLITAPLYLQMISLQFLFIERMALGEKERRKIFDIVEHIHIVIGHPSLFRCWESAEVRVNDINKWFLESPRLICQIAKRNIPGAEIRFSERSNSPGKILYYDILPPISPPTLQGGPLAIIFSDEATGCLHAFGGASKTEFLRHLWDVIAFYKLKTKIPRSDLRSNFQLHMPLVYQI